MYQGRHVIDPLPILSKLRRTLPGRVSEGRLRFLTGWDGATFDLIRPWIDAGKLPNLARLMANGVHGPLRSTVPPWSFQAWSSFLTGKNLGKHGVYDFFRNPPGTYRLEFVNATD